MGWLARVEKIFEVQNVTAWERLNWPSSVWKGAPVLGSIFGERIRRTLLRKSFPWR